MKALTVCQPYAHLIVIGEKRVENRTWPTSYRGPLLIHAGKSRAWLDDYEGGDEERYRDMVFGAILGKCELDGVCHIENIKGCAAERRWPWLLTHEHTEGLFCWILGDVVRFETPIPWKGQRGLFDIPDDVVAEATPYWAAKRKGETPRRSNGPVGWSK